MIALIYAPRKDFVGTDLVWVEIDNDNRTTTPSYRIIVGPQAEPLLAHEAAAAFHLRVKYAVGQAMPLVGHRPLDREIRPQRLQEQHGGICFGPGRQPNRTQLIIADVPSKQPIQ